MQCPRCRSEVGNQPTCPYCGCEIYTNGRQSYETPETRATVLTGQRDPKMTSQRQFSRLIATMSGMEMWVKLSSVLLAGIFVLQILIIVLMILK